jgi:asparagine synthetase B (glutamine-hydrolysing)
MLAPDADPVLRKLTPILESLVTADENLVRDPAARLYRRVHPEVTRDAGLRLAVPHLVDTLLDVLLRHAPRYDLQRKRIFEVWTEVERLHPS